MNKQSSSMAPTIFDVFIPTGNEPDAGSGIYLNNLLLERGHAVRF